MLILTKHVLMEMDVDTVIIWVQVEGMETLNFDLITLPKRVMKEEDQKRVMREEDPGMKEVVMLVLDLVATRLVMKVLVVTKLVLEVLVVIKLELVLVLSTRRKAGLKAGIFKGRRASSRAIMIRDFARMTWATDF